MDFKNLPPVKEQIMKCVRCGKCRSVCPVFAELRYESAAPRGHVFMVQMLRDGVVKPSEEVSKRLTNCLMCEKCSANCPSGIDIHELNAAARSYISQTNPSLSKDLIFDTLWTKPALLNFSTSLMWGVQKTGLQNLARKLGLMKLLPGELPQAERILDAVPLRNARSMIAEYNPAKGEKKYKIGYFLGCATDLLNPDIALATIEVLTNNGCEVIVPRHSKCCGLPQIANGKIETAQRLAEHNSRIFNAYDFDYIVTDCGSCSSALSPKNMHFLLGETEYALEGEKFAAKVIDLSKFLIDVLDVNIPANNNARKITVTYHDPCHLANVQKIKEQPRELLRRIPGVKLVEMSDTNYCCGGSGTYSITHYQTSMKILDKKMAMIKLTGAETVATCCPSCTMQLNFGIREHDMNCRVVHPIQLVRDAIRRKALHSA
ncbi:MAG TPA: (Fe-S)-binding protein [Syntrophomonadaceae bacterium]|nr:(Fe-S)-binding protein [Syntrophomonadaceae bacterium]HPR94469.1 (Fe-S)-binding protein [Syntrophomonadaceae bacterium]